jgi:hypothetical protein
MKKHPKLYNILISLKNGASYNKKSPIKKKKLMINYSLEKKD